MVKTHQWDKQPRKPHACPEAQSGTVAQPWLSQRQVHGTEKSSDHRAGCVGGHQEWMLTWPQRKAIVPQRNDENFGPAGPIEWSAKQGARVFLSFFFLSQSSESSITRLPMQEMRVRFPGSGRSPGEGNGNPLQYSLLDNPMNRGSWRATVHGITRVRHDWATGNTHTMSVRGTNSLWPDTKCPCQGTRFPFVYFSSEWN